MNRYKINGYYVTDVGTCNEWSRVVWAHTAADALTQVEVTMRIRDGREGGSRNRIQAIQSLPEGECGCIRGTERCKFHPACEE